MEITLFIIILILMVLLFDSYHRNSEIIIDKEQLILFRESALEIAGKLVETRDPSELYQYVLESSLKLIPKASSGNIFMFNSEGLLTAKASLGINGNEIRNQKLKMEGSLLFLATEGKLDRAVMINRFEDLTPNHDSALSEYRKAAFRSEISAPFHVNGELYGMLCINGDQIGAFTEQDTQILDYMARQIGGIIKNQKLHDEIFYLSRYDGLSRLLNRNSFEREAVKLLNDPSKDADNLYFVLIDLDDLKTANASLGHHVGDEIIQHFSETVSKYLGKNDVLGRYGGDEFAAVIQGDSVNVNQILEESKKELAERKFGSGDKSYTPGFSYGKASFRDGRSNLDLLCKLADPKKIQKH